MGRRLTSALAVAAVLGVTAAAAFVSVRGSGPPGASPPAKPRPCSPGQLALELATRDERPVVVVRHARGPRCIAPDYEVLVEAPQGELLVQEGSPGGLFAPGVEWERTLRFQPRCDQRGPFSAVVRVGPYSARAEIPAVPCFRTAAEVAAFHRDCVRSWNAGWNRPRRGRVVAGSFDIATLFRASDAVEVERCAVHFLSSATAESLVAYRAFARSWSLPGSPEAAYDDRPAEIRPDGALALADG
jgi:hypothetical protein